MWFPMLWSVALAAPVEAIDSVVLLQVGSTSCAGALVDESGVVATAYHCVAPGGRPKATLRDGTSAVGKVIGVDRGRDLALVQFNGLAGHSWLTTAEPVVGERAYAIGHPFGSDIPSGFYTDTLRFSIADGMVAAVGPESVQSTTPLNPGNSGGPLVNDDGDLIGVVSRRLGGQGLGFSGRVHEVDTLRDRGMSVFGGTLALEAALTAMNDGTLVVGPKLELAARDRIVVEVSGTIPVSARWTVVRFGDVAFLRGESHAGLRQRFGRGAWALRLDGWGGVGWMQRMWAPDEDPLDWNVSDVLMPTAGVTARLRNVGFEVGYGFGEDGDSLGRAALIVRMPGVFTVW